MKSGKIVGMLRIRDEGRWIADVLKPLMSLCDHVLVLDDHSTDDTVPICRKMGAKVFESEFTGFDESRDKDWLLSKVFKFVPWKDWDSQCPHWCLVIDGDEVLEEGGAEKIKETIRTAKKNAYSLRILYLWDSKTQYRVDGVYGKFRRPSLFRLMNPKFRFRSTPWAGNMHCSSVPQELIHGFGECPARLLHLGYMDREDRLRKWAWYNESDPSNSSEDDYLHIIIGDVPELPPETRRVHGGPLKLESL